MKFLLWESTILIWLAATPAIFAHASPAHGPSPALPTNWSELSRAWEFEPGVVVPLLLSALVYAVGTFRVWRTAGIGHGVSKQQAACFAAGWFALATALVSPLHRWGNMLFSVHMVQHEVLMLAAAPLLVLGRPLVAFLMAMPTTWAKAISRTATAGAMSALWGVLLHPMVAWFIHAVVLWAWHIPYLFQWAVHNEFVHAIQHLSFLLSALMFWWAVVQDKYRAIGYGAGVLYMFSTALHSGMLGALITLANRIWYPAYVATAPIWGIEALEDQQLGGLIMWAPACVVYILAGLVLFAGWLRSAEERVVRWEAAHALHEEPTP